VAQRSVARPLARQPRRRSSSRTWRGRSLLSRDQLARGPIHAHPGLRHSQALQVCERERTGQPPCDPRARCDREARLCLARRGRGSAVRKSRLRGGPLKCRRHSTRGLCLLRLRCLGPDTAILSRAHRLRAFAGHRSERGRHLRRRPPHVLITYADSTTDVLWLTEGAEALYRTASTRLDPVALSAPLHDGSPSRRARGSARRAPASLASHSCLDYAQWQRPPGGAPTPASTSACCSSDGRSTGCAGVTRCKSSRARSRIMSLHEPNVANLIAPLDYRLYTVSPVP
jgi:hypothetical protein